MEGGTEALGSVGSPGRPQLLLLCIPARPGGWVLGIGAREGCRCGECKSSRLLRLGRETPREKIIADAPGSAGKPREAQHLGGAGRLERQKCPNFSPSPPSAPKARAGERDPCPDPSPCPARAITKETRPPALQSPHRLKTDPSAGTGR